MQNIETKVTGSTLTITIDLDHRGGISKSGKSVSIASTQGNKTVQGPEGEVKLGLNCYVPR